MSKKIAYLVSLLCFSLFSFGSQAAAHTLLTLNNTSGDAVTVNVSGDSNSSIQISFLPSGATSVTTLAFGTTDSSGNFTNSISSGGYGIPAGSPVYATVNGTQSSTMLWPNYTSSLTLSQSSAQIAVGQSVSVTSSNTLILSTNSQPSYVGTAISGNKLTLTGLANGNATVTLCAANAGCKSIAVTVGASSGQTQITLSENNITLNNRESKNITVFGNSNTGYRIKSNSNPTSVTANISGNTDTVSLFANSAGSATINICAKDSDTNCANLYITALDAAANSLSFSQNNLNLIPGMSQNITISGQTDNKYYVSSNSDAAVATASINGAILTVVGGNKTGSTEVRVCSATVNATCSNLKVQTNADTNTPTTTSLAFSQNVVSVAKNSTSNVTVSGGNGSGYVLSSNSDSSKVIATISGGSNIVSLKGVTEGSATIEVCAATAGSVCASMYVNVGPELIPLKFSQNNLNLTPNLSTTVIISGGTSKNVIDSISNPNVVDTYLNSNGSALVLTGKSAGTSVIKVCDEPDSTNCSDVTVSVIVSNSNTNNNTGNGNSSTNSGDNSTHSSLTQLEKINSDTTVIFSGNLNSLLNKINAIQNRSKEGENLTKYIAVLASNQTNLPSGDKDRLNYFITYGTETTLTLGAGERAGVLGSYKKAFGKLPQTENEWSDAIKIANGRWPAVASQTALDSAKNEFKKVYNRAANMNNANDNAAVSVIAYGLRPSTRNTNSEKAAIKSFRSIYGHDPVSSLAWDIVRAIAYSGAKR